MTQESDSALSITKVVETAFNIVCIRKPMNNEELRHAHEVMAWQLAGYETELWSVLEGYQ